VRLPLRSQRTQREILLAAQIGVAGSGGPAKASDEHHQQKPDRDEEQKGHTASNPDGGEAVPHYLYQLYARVVNGFVSSSDMPHIAVLKHLSIDHLCISDRINRCRLGFLGEMRQHVE
jgi:hypothetical protein